MTFAAPWMAGRGGVGPYEPIPCYALAHPSPLEKNQMDHEAVQSADREVVKSMDILAQSHVTVRVSPAT